MFYCDVTIYNIKKAWVIWKENFSYLKMINFERILIELN